METSTYIFLAIAIFIIGRMLFADRSPIPETSGKVYKLTSQAELDALLSSTKHVIVDFYADWCPPCRAIAPVFSEWADKHAAGGSLAFAKVNVDHVNAIAKTYNVTAMPTFVFFRDGKPQGVEVPSLKPRQSVSFTSEGLVDRVRGADRAALQAVVNALAGPQEAAKKE